MNNNDYIDQEFGIKQMLLHCGVSPKTKGFDFLAKAVYLYTRDRRRKLCDIYAEIAEETGCDEHTVHNYTDYALNTAKNLCVFINKTLETDYVSYRLNNKSAVILLAICYAENNTRKKIGQPHDRPIF